MFNQNHYDECLTCKCSSCESAEICKTCQNCSGEQVCSDDVYANHKEECDGYVPAVNEYELSAEQLARIDEVENSIFAIIKIMTQNYDMEWDMSVIGDIADVVSARLTELGYKVLYPALILDEEGNAIGISEFYSS